MGTYILFSAHSYLKYKVNGIAFAVFFKIVIINIKWCKFCCKSRLTVFSAN